MKQIIVLIAVVISLTAHSQNNPDAIIGKWLKIPKEDLIIEVFKTGTEYRGKITWTKDAEKKNNVGFLILQNLKYNSRSKRWKGGKINDPNSGRTYDAEARIKSDSTLEVHAYKGMKFLGTKKYFKRV